jgi:hypothetical protein
VKTVQVKITDRKNPLVLHHRSNVVVQAIKRFLSDPGKILPLRTRYSLKIALVHHDGGSHNRIPGLSGTPDRSPGFFAHTLQQAMGRIFLCTLPRASALYLSKEKEPV